MYGKVRQVTKSNGNWLQYRYDATGNRISKTEGTVGNRPLRTQYYVRDASGNVMAIYEQKSPLTPEGGVVTLLEQPIYGSSRLGTYNGQTTRGTQTLGNKNFEISNHLGNVLLTFTDNKYQDLKINSATDYYPFGMTMKGREFQARKFRYGFNNQEVDNDFGSGSVVFKYRIHNVKIGRFWSVDPLAAEYPWNSTYAFAENRVIDGIDLEGKEWISPATYSMLETGATKLKNGINTVRKEGYFGTLGLIGQSLHETVSPTLNRVGATSLAVNYTYVHGSGKFNNQYFKFLERMFPKVLDMRTGHVFLSSYGLSIAADHDGNMALFLSVSQGIGTPNSGGFSVSPSLMLNRKGKRANIFSDYQGWGITYSVNGSLGANPYLPISVGGSYFQPLDGISVDLFTKQGNPQSSDIRTLKGLDNPDGAFDGYSLNIAPATSTPSVNTSIMVGETKKLWDFGATIREYDKKIRSFFMEMQIKHGINTGY